MNKLARSSRDIGVAIRNARKAQNLTQAELASRSGIWQETISKLENGNSGTKLETLFDVCAALGLDLRVTERSKGSPSDIEENF